MATKLPRRQLGQRMIPTIQQLVLIVLCSFVSLGTCSKENHLLLPYHTFLLTAQQISVCTVATPSTCQQVATVKCVTFKKVWTLYFISARTTVPNEIHCLQPFAKQIVFSRAWKTLFFHRLLYPQRSPTGCHASFDSVLALLYKHCFSDGLTRSSRGSVPVEC